MTERLHRHGTQNHAYQIDMAKSLLGSLGCAEALAFCRQQGWEGVVRHVLGWCREEDCGQDAEF
jgi:hypothetical protein